MAEEGEVVDVEESPTTEVEQTEETGDQVENQEEATTSDGDDASEATRQNKGVGKRINELTREKYEAKREAEYWRARAEEVARQQVQQPQQTQQQEGPPDISQFSTFEEYQRATARYETRLAIQEERQREANARARFEAESKAQRDRTTWSSKESEARDKIVDYDETISTILDDPQIMHHVGIGEALVASDMGPEVLYYLGKNPTEARQIAQFSPAAAAKAIGRIEARIEAQQKQQSKAPPPPRTVGGSSKAVAGLRDDLPVDEWLKQRNKELYGSRR